MNWREYPIHRVGERVILADGRTTAASEAKHPRTIVIDEAVEHNLNELRDKMITYLGIKESMGGSGGRLGQTANAVIERATGKITEFRNNPTIDKRTHAAVAVHIRLPNLAAELERIRREGTPPEKIDTPLFVDFLMPKDRVEDHEMQALVTAVALFNKQQKGKFGEKV